MRFLRLYARVLAQLRAEGALAVALVVANVAFAFAVAFAQFAEPLLLGRVVDKLAAAQGSQHLPQWGDLAPLLAAWGGSGCSRSWRASPSRSIRTASRSAGAWLRWRISSPI